jgi:hypothetical protein
MSTATIRRPTILTKPFTVSPPYIRAIDRKFLGTRKRATAFVAMREIGEGPGSEET